MNRIGGAAAWRGSDVRDDAWCHVLDDGATAELVDRARRDASDIEAGRLRLDRVALGTTPSPALDRLGATLRSELFDGRGFALVRGIPVDDLGELGRQVAFWLLGLQVGVPLRQNADGDVLVRVRDEGKDFAEFGVRAYETTAHLDYHTDSADVAALLCRRPARRGGTSTIVSSVAVHDEIVRRRPDLARLLHEPWPEINPVDGTRSSVPIAAVGASGRLFTRYGRKYTELAADRVPLTREQVELLDLYDEITNDGEFVLDMDFRPGDVQFLNNHVVLHARTAYEDWPEPERRRELLRLWLVAPDEVELPASFAAAGFVPRTEVTGVR